MNKRPMRAALYARVSTKDKGQDTENQLAQLRQFCEAQGWTIVHDYVDHVTGKHSDREHFQRLFQDASQRRFDVVLFWSLDRFSREGVRETLNHLERLTSEAHAALAAVLSKCQAKVAVSSYRSPLNDEIFKGWRCIEATEKLCHSVKTLRQEVLFVNYDPEDLTPYLKPRQVSLLTSEDD